MSELPEDGPSGEVPDLPGTVEIEREELTNPVVGESSPPDNDQGREQGEEEAMPNETEETDKYDELNPPSGSMTEDVLFKKAHKTRLKTVTIEVHEEEVHAIPTKERTASKGKQEDADVKPGPAGDDEVPRKMGKVVQRGTASSRASFDVMHDKELQEAAKRKAEREEGHKVKPIMSQEFLQYLRVENDMRLNCLSLPFTACLWVAFILLNYIHGSVGTAFNMGNALRLEIDNIEILTKAMETRTVETSVSNDIFVTTPPPVDNPFTELEASRSISLKTLSSTSDIWKWLADGLLPMIYNQETGNMTDPYGWPIRRLRLYNLVIGAIRLRQKRAGAAACSITGSLLDFYGQAQCFDPADEEKSPFNLGANVETTGLFAPVQEYQPVISGSTPYFLAWLDVARTPSLLLERLEQLEAGGWLDQATSEVLVTIPLLNAEVGRLALLEITLKMERGGLIKHDVQVHSGPTQMYPDWSHLIPDFLWLLLVVTLLQQEIRQVMKNFSEGELWKYFKDPWNLIDWLSIVLGTIIGVFWMSQLSLSGSIVNQIVGVPRMPNTPQWKAISYNELAVLGPPDNLYHQSLHNLIDDMHLLLADYFQGLRLLMFWYTVILVLRFIKGFRGQPRVAVVAVTMLSSLIDLAHYGIVFAVIFVNFALGAYVVFGNQIEAWSSGTRSMNTALRMLLGSAREEYQQMFEVQPFSAVVWYWVFVFLLWLLLLNLLLALILDSYATVKYRLHDTSKMGTMTLWAQIKDTWSELRWKMSFEGSKAPLDMSELIHELERMLEIPVNKATARMNMGQFKRMTLAQGRKNKSQEQKRAPKTLSMDILCEAGCDSANAARMLTRFRKFTHTNDDFDPVDRLATELNSDFTLIDARLDDMEVNMARTAASLILKLERLEQRQTQLVSMSESLQRTLEIPEEWVSMSDPRTGKTYYCNVKSGQTTWQTCFAEITRLDVRNSTRLISEVPRQFESAMKVRQAMKGAGFHKVQSGTHLAALPPPSETPDAKKTNKLKDLVRQASKK